MDLGTGGEQFELSNCAELKPSVVPVPPTSAEFLAAALRHARVGTWQVDMHSRWLTWDAVTSEILGLPSRWKAAEDLPPIHPDDKAAVWRRLQREVFRGGTASIEFRIVRPDNEVRWVRATGRQRDTMQVPGKYVAGIVTDVTEERAAAESRREAEDRYRLVSQLTSDLIFDWHITNDRLRWNEAKGDFFGYTPDELSSMGALRNNIHPDDRERISRKFAELFASEEATYTSEHRFQNSDGTYAEVRACGHIFRDANGSPVRIIGAIQDLTERSYADAALRESEAINRGIVEASTDSVVLLDLEGRLLFLNRSRGLAINIEDIGAFYGRHWTSVWPEFPSAGLNDAVKRAARGERVQFTECFEYAGGAHWCDVVISPICNSAGEPTKLVAIARDVTEQREATEKLRRAATYDALTNLPNRACFQDRLADAAAHARTIGSRFGLLLLDVDDFKQVNDSMGHDAGDALLKSIASRLELPSPRPHAVARLGGDEFAVLLEDIVDAAELASHARSILRRMKEPLVHDGRVLDCHVTIGAALFPDHGSTQDEVLKSADIALYVAKATARGELTTFEPGHRDGLRERASMVSLARSALKDGRIVPFYQPKLALADRRVDGFEALLRWRHPTRGIQLPAMIAAAFEDLDVSTALSQSMIDQVIGDMRRWLDRGVAFGHIAVNAAAAEFRSDNFAEGVLDRLRAAGVPTCHMQLEVTETVFLGKGAEYVDRALKLLDREGVRIALDDFGTGYASLRHLKQFPVHVMKIDQGFVKGMGSNPDDAAIISAVLNLGKSLNIEVVAEGIETIEQETRLRDLGCEFGQGFLYSEAVAADFVPKLLAQVRDAPASLVRPPAHQDAARRTM